MRHTIPLPEQTDLPRCFTRAGSKLVLSSSLIPHLPAKTAFLSPSLCSGHASIGRHILEYESGRFPGAHHAQRSDVCTAFNVCAQCCICYATRQRQYYTLCVRPSFNRQLNVGYPLRRERPPPAPSIYLGESPN